SPGRSRAACRVCRERRLASLSRSEGPMASPRTGRPRLDVAGARAMRVPRGVRVVSLALIAATLVSLVVVIGEVAPRLVALAEPPRQTRYARDSMNPGLYRLDDAAGYMMAPYYEGSLHGADFDQIFETNSRGLRDRELEAKQPGEFRIVVLGDSFVMGAEVAV